jgi:hypothetical protein
LAVISGVVAISKSFEHFYVKDLEAKLDAYRFDLFFSNIIRFLELILWNAGRASFS